MASPKSDLPPGAHDLLAPKTAAVGCMAMPSYSSSAISRDGVRVPEFPKRM